MPTLAYAGETVHVSGYLGPIVVIIVVVICFIAAMYALNYWKTEIGEPLGKILRFAAIMIAVIIVVVILLGLAGVHIT